MSVSIRLTGIAAAALLALALGAGPAAAKQIRQYAYSGEFINGSNSDSGPFSLQLEDVDFDAANDRVVVLDGGASGGAGSSLSAFTPDGQPDEFAALGSNTIFLVPPGETLGLFPRLGLDNSGGPANGNMYVYGSLAVGPSLTGFAPDGSQLPGFPRVGLAETCGVGVDPQGQVWITKSDLGSSSLIGLDAAGEPTGNVIEGIEEEFLCQMSIDADGSFYIGDGHRAPVYKYAPQGELLYRLTDFNTSDVAVDRSDGVVFAVTSEDVTNPVQKVVHYDSTGAEIGRFGTAPEPGFPGLDSPHGIAVDPGTHEVWVTDQQSQPGGRRVYKFEPSAPIAVPTVTTGTPEPTLTTATLRGAVDADGIDTTDCRFEWGTTLSYGNEVPCEQGLVFTGPSGAHQVSGQISGLTKGTLYHFRLSAENANGVVSYGADGRFRAQAPVEVDSAGVTNLGTDGATLGATIDPGGGDTTYHFEWGTDTGYGNRIPPTGELSLDQVLDPEQRSHALVGLSPDTEYHFRVVAQNLTGSAIGDDVAFRTFALPVQAECPNQVPRQQARSSHLLDCRAYELVSSANAGGYDVVSNLMPGQSPLPAHPRAAGKALYSVHFGSIPGLPGSPTTFGRDPYVATRGPDGWSTRYVGLPADGMSEDGAYGSPLLGADPLLETIAFGGPEICDPCFADGSTNVPLRLADGSLVKGMAGSLDPGPANPAGTVRRPFSADGEHFLFGTTAQLEPEANDSGTDVTIYDRNLGTDATQVVSTLPGGMPIENGAGVAALDVSADGSRVLVGELVGTDAEGNELYDLYMHVDGSPGSVEVLDSPSGAIFAGMDEAGTKVYFATADPLAGDGDTSADLFRADVGATVDVTAVTGVDSDLCAPVANSDNADWNAIPGGPTDCSAVPVGGGGGVAAQDGTAFFLSPENLDGEGAVNEPNLYVARPGSPPEHVATLEPDNPLVRNSVAESGARHSEDLQVAPGGEHAVFASRRELGGLPTNGRAMVYRYELSSGGLSCVSCTPAGIVATGDATLSAHGLNLTDDGRVFFTSPDPLVLRDSNGRSDPYEWSEGAVQLISTGLWPDDSKLLSVSADGVDAFFFTRDTLVPEDENGNTVKIYTAREGGGVLFDPPLFPCAAKDECQGAGTQQAPPPAIRTLTGAGPRTPAGPPRCDAGKLDRRAKAAARRAKRLRAKGMRRKAGRAARAARRARAAARRCRQAGGRT